MMLRQILWGTLLYMGVVYGDSNLTIHHDYNTTLEVAKKENKPIFILFGKEKCKWCEKLKSEILTIEAIEETLKKEYIVLLLDKDNDTYPEKYKIKAVPTVFLMSDTEELYTEIVGYHAKPRDYTKWFNYVRIERED